MTPTVQFVIFVIYEVQPDSVPRCLTSYSNRECFGLIQNKKLRCISNHSALSSAISEFAFPGHKFAPRRKIFSVLQTTIVRSELPGRSSMYGFFHTTPRHWHDLHSRHTCTCVTPPHSWGLVTYDVTDLERFPISPEVMLFFQSRVRIYVFWLFSH